ncbi:hypothetical protein TTHERM_00727760 (macronuclear) [Tetrahymena thermophila SB210]|uniref:Uncharacterized protein n=1 Tax=Tetrahymena thermophila (strain SB210) TaxID=312017 RepID=I7M363_TETTS|nr:hypothetical protein TTHERM_00727760 [Tetrahymena thermophila SB210]EAS02416.1 hypothetical protein TTHERM_00727760 [Tetrahymena thermophila SB210]|eukprot:XP_001022661.1 hypothetical protein TTHERM_00727760 [Tetrahymena thermophila SB210]
MNPNSHPQFQKPPASMSQQKVKLNQSVSFYRFIIGGLGYGGIDFISKQIFGEGKHYESLKKYEQQTNDKLKNVEFSKEKLLEKLDQHEQLKVLQEQLQESQNSSTILKNFIYGFLATNLGSIFHAKLNNHFKTKGYSSNKKMFLSPFSFLPYYLFCGIYDKLPLEELGSRIAKDFLPLFVIRLTGDIIRYKIFSKYEQQAIASGNQFINNPRLFGYHMLLRGVYILSMDTFYHQRVQIF